VKIGALLDYNRIYEKGFFTGEEAMCLIEPFTEAEIKTGLDQMKTNSAPGLDVLLSNFYKVLWDQVKKPVLEMSELFYKGELNLSRLNYGLISLIPKLKEANNIKQYRPICLLGVDYKWFTKVLTEVADFVVSKTQTTFIPGRYSGGGCNSA
jgi:hypothetical protein